MDSSQPVEARTMLDHQGFQMRDSARINARALAKSIDEGALRAGVVVDISNDGRVALDDFSNSDGVSTWMAVMSRIYPKIGDVAVYGMIQGSPVCLGIMPDEYDSYRVNSPNFIYEIEHFHTFGTYANGGVGKYGLGFASASGSFNAVTTPGLFTPLQGNGWAQLVTGNVIGNFAQIMNATGVQGISLYTLNSFEMGLAHAGTGGQLVRIGLTDTWNTAGGNGITLVYDSAISVNWFVESYSGGVLLASIDSGIPVPSSRMFCVRFTKLDQGVWEVHYREPLNDSQPTSIAIVEKVPNANVNFGAILLNRAAAGRILYIDYIAWAIEGMVGVF